MEKVSRLLMRVKRDRLFKDDPGGKYDQNYDGSLFSYFSKLCP